MKKRLKILAIFLALALIAGGIIYFLYFYDDTRTEQGAVITGANKTPDS
jgi:hypothetical protein